MNARLVDEIVACLPQGRTCFNYYPERYAWLLLRHAVGEGATVGALKRSPFAGLLQKPRVKQWLARLGSDRIRPGDLIVTDGDAEQLAFTLTLSQWQGAQTTRNDANLVLQLNFDRGHDRRYQELVRPSSDGVGPFACSGHPICRTRNTLAWARLDIDLDAGEVLIEEIQNDWLRKTAWALENPARWPAQIGGQPADVLRYLRWVQARYRKIWAEAMLAATIWFVREELGLRRLFFHSPESGVLLKRLPSCRQPPRSIYTDLPRQFCFRETGNMPRFFARRQCRRARNAPLYELQLSGVPA
ncbi:hypothetical protein [Jeongeupia chitinilytica]|uniref:Uncharacterized protein n=1 Tax=Jeongeupia chitinilytica TaxID=1041641 RepID=A0ABQ3GZ14_9NEIS|nr:hypothetical protein [Jeongeupia chitinilytica]GHD60584.1 hypothetical protein GCM10007350_13850 [Jeongeupia chitinilytica]